jgi:hypothetical protein
MKEKLSTLASIAGIGLFIYFFWIRPDYSWANEIIETKTNEDWILVATSTSAAIIKPWTLFQAPVTDIWFAKKGDIARLDDTHMIGHIYSASYNDDKTEGYEYFKIFNCSENKSVILDNDSEITNFDPTKADWIASEEGTPGAKIMDYYCAQNKQYSMLNFLGEDIDISNYIISGKYSLVDTSQFIFEIRNNYPYVPTMDDEVLLRDAITSWLHEKYTNENFNLPLDLYSKCKYKTSLLTYGIPDDIYTVEINPNLKIGKIAIEFQFTRISIPEQYRKEDEVRILSKI